MLQIRNKYVQRGNYIYNTRREKKKRRKPQKIFSIIKRQISQKKTTPRYIIHSYKYKISADDNNQRSFFLFFSFLFFFGRINLRIKN